MKFQKIMNIFFVKPDLIRLALLYSIANKKITHKSEQLALYFILYYFLYLFEDFYILKEKKKIKILKQPNHFPKPTIIIALSGVEYTFSDLIFFSFTHHTALHYHEYL